MKFVRLDITEVVLCEPEIYHDDRGFFYESFNSAQFKDGVGVDVDFVQDNISHSVKGVLRGLHYQLPPKAQGKLVQAMVGTIFDVAVDIRKNSPTFGKWVGVILSSENKKQLWIPAGFAHGFLTLSDTATVHYKTTDYYAKELEGIILWSDGEVGIEWPNKELAQLSAKDACGAPLLKATIFD